MQTEVWQRGPIEGIPALLQPVAHTLLQTIEEAESLMLDFPDELLWEKPAGVASPGFHLRHMAGVIDRLYTYARNEPLTTSQLQYLKQETLPDTDLRAIHLITILADTIKAALRQLAATDIHSLTEFRGIGRKQLPSTVIGLLFHSAEHIMRHLGQLLVTVRILRNQEENRA